MCGDDEHDNDGWKGESSGRVEAPYQTLIGGFDL